MQTVSRYDIAELSEPIKLDNGYLRCPARITRVGVFTYRLGNGKTRSELRLPEDVFKADAMESFSDMALTNDHPPVALTSKNTRKYQVGHVNSIRREPPVVPDSGS